LDERTLPPPAVDDARDALRRQIADAVAQAGVFPVARRTVELLLDAATEPTPEGPGYRAIDRAGLPRPPVDVDRPMTLTDLIEELRGKHPALFVAREPAPEVATPVDVPAVASPDIKAATGRFVDAQSVRARAFLTRSMNSGRAVAASAVEAWTQMRPRRSAAVPAETVTPAKGEPSASPPQALSDAAPASGPHPGGRFRETAQDAVLQARGRWSDAVSRMRDRAHDRTFLRDALDRRALVIGLGALVIVGVAVVLTGRSGEEASSPAQPEAQAPGSASVPGNPAPGVAQDTSPAPIEEAPKVLQANEISGPAEVIDTATLRVGGKLVRLFGVEWVRGGQADELTRYLAGRSVSCQPVAGSEARLCAVDGRDLSEVVLFNGGGRASSEATPDLVAAEDRARSERLGVWAR
jgi:endonuclease YncB( thermonuclease family)